MNNSKIQDKIHPSTKDFGGRVHAIGCDVTERQLQNSLEKIAAIPSLSSKIVCLPDLYLKARTEAPASIVTAINNAIVPTLSAPSLGCSMGVIATNLTAKDLTENTERVFFNHMQDELGKYYNFWDNIAVWLGLKTRRLNKYDLSLEEFDGIVKRGAKAAIQRYGFSEKILENIEWGGSVYSNEEIRNLDLKKILPRSSFTNGRHDLGYGFKGNHFLEIHVIEDIFDSKTASAWGLSKDQIVIFYHGGGGMVPYHMGRYYANRMKNNLKQKFFLRIGKLFFHLFSMDGIKNFRERARYYFFPELFQEIKADSMEGIRYGLAIKAALNYSYAFNIALMARVRDALKNTFKDKNIEIRPIYALVHNSIIKEKVGPHELFVHRHTLNRVEEGKPTILSGFNNTISYIGIGLKPPPETLWSAEHGAGENIKRFEREGKSREDSGRETIIFKTKPPPATHVKHRTAEGVDFVMTKLEEAGLMRKVLSLRPLASFKG